MSHGVYRLTAVYENGRETIFISGMRKRPILMSLSLMTTRARRMEVPSSRFVSAVATRLRSRCYSMHPRASFHHPPLRVRGDSVRVMKLFALHAIRNARRKSKAESKRGKARCSWSASELELVTIETERCNTQAPVCVSDWLVQSKTHAQLAIRSYFTDCCDHVDSLLTWVTVRYELF